jgi:large conductance mechanosensitive channel
MLKTVQGFKDFIMRGNVIDLSVGIVIGAAFTAVVSAFTKSFIEPLIRVFGGGDISGGAFEINGVAFDWASFLNAAITFLITAAVVYFLIVTPMNRLAERRRKGEEPEPTAPSEEVILLQQIRDALVAGDGVPRPRRDADEPETAYAAAPAAAAAAPAAAAPAAAPAAAKAPVRTTIQPRKSPRR